MKAKLVSNFAEAGGVITGVTNALTQVDEKYLEALLEAVPKAPRIVFLLDPTNLACCKVMK